MWPSQLYTAQQSRNLDASAIASGIDGYSLMCRAGEAAFALLQRAWPSPSSLHIVCGMGNNGGDGLVVARLAHAQQIPVAVYLQGDPSRLRGEAFAAYRDAVAAGVQFLPLPQEPVCDGVIVDALLGTGLSQPVREESARVIHWINRCQARVLALDLPSGLCGDSGNEMGCAVHATRTITFIAAKRGLFTGSGVECSGEVTLAGLDLPAALYAEVGETVSHPRLADLLALLPPRRRNAHKGDCGHLLVIGGDHGMGGAALLAASAAARSGAGLVSVATRQEHLPAILSRHPEIMARGVESGSDLDALLQRATVIVAGPGLGRSSWSEHLLQRALASGLPLVLDADALNLLAENSRFQRPSGDNHILTPHPGEAARLLGVATAEIAADRFRSAEAIRTRHGGTVVLKGAGTVIASPSELALSSYGNPGMASGGMGDVLSGVIGGLLAQKLAPADAALLGVALHGRAADLAAAADGERGLQASDLLPYLRSLVNAGV